jgi:flagellin
MGLRISTNMASIAAQRSLANSEAEQTKTYEKLASGQRINSAGDDAAGLSISENLRGQIRSMGQAKRNANDGISFAQVAEGGLNEVSNMMIRLRELAVQAASDTIGDKERGYINKEVQSLVQEVDRIANVTNFNGTPLLNGKSSKENLEFQVGTRNAEEDRLKFNTRENDVRASTLGIDGLNYESQDGAREAIDRVDKATSMVNSSRARLGATQNRLHSTVNTIGVSEENLAAARSRIADTDIAQATSDLVRGNILQAAGIAVLSQANQTPTQALKLL